MVEARAETAADAGTSAPAGEADNPIESVDLEDLLARPVRSGEAGSFGYGLESSLFKPYLRAYTTFDWYKQQGGTNTFDAHYFNVFTGVNIRDTIIPELQLEHEHGDEISVRYAQVDVRIIDELYVRAGLWLVPFGIYNEFLYPEYLTVLPRSPMVLSHRDIVPTAWNDVGIQLRGRAKVAADVAVDYALYVSNGLEQEDDPTTPEVESGGSIRGMRGNFRDQHHGDKAVGGRVGVNPLDGVSLGVSFYTGAYTEDGERRLSLFGAHGSYERDRLTVRVEGVYGVQTVPGPELEKWGLYARAAYAITDWIQPALGFDVVRLDGAPEDDKWGLIGGINVRPHSELLPTLVLRLAAAHYQDEGANPDDDIVLSQMTLGF